MSVAFMFICVCVSLRGGWHEEQTVRWNNVPSIPQLRPPHHPITCLLNIRLALAPSRNYCSHRHVLGILLVRKLNNGNKLFKVSPLRTFFPRRFVPESPRWLISQKNYPRALEITKAIAKENKKKFSNNFEVNQIFSITH